MKGVSQTIIENHSNASTEPVTSPRGVSDSYASLSGADHEGENAHPLFTAAYLPGLRAHSGRDVEPEDVKEVISLLGQAGAPACVAGVYAMRYFGARRISSVSLVPLFLSCNHDYFTRFRHPNHRLVHVSVVLERLERVEWAGG